VNYAKSTDPFYSDVNIMPLKIGNTLPSAILTQVSDSGPKLVSTDDFFLNKTVVLFGVPGAFTPTCSEKHLPGFLQHADALFAKGVDTIACITVNDPFVVSAWSKAHAVEAITMISDGNADYVEALGMSIDMSDRGFGTRSARFALIAVDGVITYIEKEDATKDHTVSAASFVLGQLD